MSTRTPTSTDTIASTKHASLGSAHHKTYFKLHTTPVSRSVLHDFSFLSVHPTLKCKAKYHTHIKKLGKTIIFCALIFTILNRRWEDNSNNQFSYHENVQNTVQFIPDICSVVFLCFGNEMNPDDRFCMKR
jgi:hypothetical protein